MFMKAKASVSTMLLLPALLVASAGAESFEVPIRDLEPAKVAVGGAIFHDTNLSESCASCHF